MLKVTCSVESTIRNQMELYNIFNECFSFLFFLEFKIFTSFQVCAGFYRSTTFEYNNYSSFWFK